jgi:hypothetical protein
MDRLAALNEWIEEHRQEIAECPATAAGYRKAGSLQWGLERLLEYRQREFGIPLPM